MSSPLKNKLRACWWGLLAWQIGWHALLPEPGGSQNWLLAMVALLPLALLTPLFLRDGQRGRLYGGMAVLIYFIIGVMEAWSNVPQRIAALVQVGLCVAWMLFLFVLSRLQAKD